MVSLRSFLFFLALVFAIGGIGCKANPTPVGGSYYQPVDGQRCTQLDPSISPGRQANDSGNPYADWYWTGQGNVSTPLVTNYYGATNGSAVDMRGNMDTMAKMPDPCDSPDLFVVTQCYNNSACYSPVTADVCPQITLFNMQTGSIDAGPTTPTCFSGGAGNQPHDAPSIAGGIAPGCAFVSYGGYSAASPGVAAWAAFGTNGESGSTYFAEPMIFGCNLNASPDSGSFLTAANQGFMGVTGLTEATTAQNCHYTGCFIVDSGQLQKGTLFNVVQGQQDVIVGRITGTGATGVQWDSQCGPQTILTATASLCNWAYVPTQSSTSDRFFYVTTSAPATSGTVTFNTSGVTACTTAVTATAGATALATLQALAAAWNGSTGTTDGCPNTNYRLYAASTTVGGCTANGCVAFGKENGDPALDTVPASVTTCTNLGTCSAPSREVSNILNYNWGGIRYAQGYYWLLGDIQNDTGTELGGLGNGYPMAFYAMRIQVLPTAAQGIEICDVAGNNCYDKSLSPTGSPTTAQTTYKLVGAGGGGTCASNGLSDCVEPGQTAVSTWCTKNCTDSGTTNPFLIRPCSNAPASPFPQASASNPPFLYSWDLQSQHDQSSTVPLSASSAKDLAVDGSKVYVAWIGQDETQHMSVFFESISRATKQVTCGTVFSNATGTVQYVGTISIAQSLSGKLYITESVGDGGATTGCTAFTGTCVLQWVSSNNGSTWGSATVIRQALTGHSNSVASVGNIFDTEDGLHVWDLLIPGACTAGSCGVYLTDHVIP